MILDSETFDKALTKSCITEVINMEHIMTAKWCFALKGYKQGREYSIEKNAVFCVKERQKIKQNIYITREVLLDLLPGNSGVLLKR